MGRKQPSRRTLPLARSAYEMQHHAQHDRRKNSCDHVVDHHAHAAFDALVEPADGPGFPHVEQAEQGEACEQQPPERDVRRQQCRKQQRDQCDPLADEFVPDQAAVIVDAERATRA
jgi:hypothetical protein